MPEKVKIEIDLVRGEKDSLDVASDIHGKTENNEWSLEKNITLPSKIHLHATDEVCIKQVRLLVILDDDGNEYEYLNVSATELSECLDYNVCSRNNEELCGRSLMYYDEVDDCAVLSPYDNIFPRDLSLFLNGQECTLLTSWSHEDIGESFFIEVTETNTLRSQHLQIEDLLSEVHSYKIAPSGEEVNSIPLNECDQLPLTLSLSSGGESQLKGVKIMRYNTEISGVLFKDFFNCSSLCDRLVNSDSVILNKESAISMLTVGLLGEKKCEELETVETKNITGNEDENGEMACTDPSLYEVSNSSDLSILIEQIATSSQYKSVNVIVPIGGLRGPGTITTPPNRRLSLGPGNGTDDEIFMTDLKFIVSQYSEMYSVGVNLQGNLSIEVQNGGLFDLQNCIVEITTNTSFLVNHGNANMDDVFLFGNSTISNERGGTLSLSYVTFEDESMILTANNSFLSVARVVLHENIDLGGEISFTYAAREYIQLEKNERNCNASDDRPETFNHDVELCLKECDKKFFCTGALWWIDSDVVFHCNLCLQEDGCLFDCSNEDAYFFKPEEKLSYTAVDGCLDGSREMRNWLNLTFSECQLYCSYFKACEGVSFLIKDSTSNCKLYADVDFGSCHLDEDKKRIYLDYNESYSNNFQQINGTITAENAEIAKYPLKNIYECSAICSKTLECESFALNEEYCILLNSRVHKPSQPESPLFISKMDFFPKKRFMVNLNKQVSGKPIASFASKTKKICTNYCNNEENCLTFSFELFSTGSKNCLLFDETATLIDKEGAVSANTAYSYDAYIPTSSNFIQENEITGLLLEECKTICIHNEECSALRYFNGTNNTDSICYLGEVFDDPLEPSSNESLILLSDPPTTDFQSSIAMFQAIQDDLATYILSAISSNFDTLYENTRTCYRKEMLDSPVLDPEISNGYAKFERKCVRFPDDAEGSKGLLSPAKCATQCDLSKSCVGYVYFNNYYGEYNSNKLGTCTFLKIDDISFDKCDGSENNMDVYIRGDLSLTCEAACSFDPKCVSYFFNSTTCELYSDIGLLAVNDKCEEKSINVKADFKARGNIMTVANNTCLEDIDIDTGEIGCYGNFTGIDDLLYLTSAEDMSPKFCRDTCRSEVMQYYAISDGVDCYCYDSFDTFANLTTGSCTSECPADPKEKCGGPEAATVGETLPPSSDVTQIQCMDKCLETPSCKAALYDKNERKCQMYTVDTSVVCEQIFTERILLLKSSAGRFYNQAEAPYSFTVFHTDYKPLQQDCEKLCTLYDNCGAIRYDDSNSTKNCELLFGDFETPNYDYDLEPDIFIANNIIRIKLHPENEESIKRTLLPQNIIANYNNIYHIDQCSGLCASNVRCGSIGEYMFRQLKIQK